MQAAGSSEKLVHIYQIARRHIPEDRNSIFRAKSHTNIGLQETTKRLLWHLLTVKRCIVKSYDLVSVRNNVVGTNVGITGSTDVPHYWADS
jgi:hypothetical protein